MMRGATQVCYSANGRYTEREALDDYLRQGYISHERNVTAAQHFAVHDQPWGSAATSLEYASADFAISRFATALGDTANAAAFLARSANWQKLLNPASHYIEPRFSTGAFIPGYDPTRSDGFVEGDSAQYTWAVPFNPAGLFDAIGGRDVANTRLDGFFQNLNGGPRANSAFLSNEPTQGTPWLYDWLGRPYRTQEVVRRALTTLYALGPAGLAGNDDGGALSAWWVLGAIGMYPAVPGDDLLALGSPLFRRTTMKTAHGKVVITAPDAARDAPYVQSMTVRGAPYTRPWLRFSQIVRGARINYGLGSQLDPNWGSRPEDAPASYPAPPVPAPPVAARR
jgi:predicted alpha-1,2-mannosidase